LVRRRSNICRIVEDAPEAGRNFGRYQHRELVAVSGMGVPYRVWDPTLECVVAIKLVSEETIPDESARRQIYTEARIASSLRFTAVLVFCRH
jgi:serine/threonine protein kinase